MYLSFSSAVEVINLNAGLFAIGREELNKKFPCDSRTINTAVDSPFYNHSFRVLASLIAFAGKMTFIATRLIFLFLVFSAKYIDAEKIIEFSLADFRDLQVAERTADDKQWDLTALFFDNAGKFESIFFPFLIIFLHNSPLKCSFR